MSSIAASSVFRPGELRGRQGGVMALTRVLSRETAKRGIRVNSIAPGVIIPRWRTPFRETRAEMLKDIPLNRFGDADEVARWSSFSLAAGFVHHRQAIESMEAGADEGAARLVTAGEAVAAIPSGASLAVGGFVGAGHRNCSRNRWKTLSGHGEPRDLTLLTPPPG